MKWIWIFVYIPYQANTAAMLARQHKRTLVTLQLQQQQLLEVKAQNMQQVSVEWGYSCKFEVIFHVV